MLPAPAWTLTAASLPLQKGGTYTLSGTLSDGRVIVNAKGEDVTLILSNADITCSYGSPLYIYKSSPPSCF